MEAPYMNLNKFGRTVILLLCLLLLLTAAGCAGRNKNKSNESTYAGSRQISVEDETTAEITSAVEPKDYGGYEFRILERELADGTNIYYEAFSAEMNGDIINDAVWQRNSMIEERNGINMVSTVMPNNNMKGAVSTMVSSGDNLYDVIFCYGGYTMYFAVNNYVRDMNSFDCIDFSRDWWYTSTMDESKISGKNAFAVGDICTASYTATVCIFYNKTLGAEYNVPNCYEFVLDNQWTYETFKQAGLNVTVDLDGNGLDANDQYTLAAANWAYQPYFYGQRYNLISKNADGDPEITTLGEKEMDTLVDIIKLCNADTTWYLTKYKSSGLSTEQVFESGKCLFWAQLMVGAGGLRNMPMDFGILPLPKSDTSQESYVSYLHTKTSLLSVPVTNSSDDERTGHIIEDMAFYSWKIIRPQYFEVLFDGIISRDSETCQMLDIIYDNVFMDLVQPLGGVDLSINTILRNLIDTNNTSVASTWSANISKNDQILKGVIEKYKTLK